MLGVYSMPNRPIFDHIVSLSAAKLRVCKYAPRLPGSLAKVSSALLKYPDQCAPKINISHASEIPLSTISSFKSMVFATKTYSRLQNNIHPRSTLYFASAPRHEWRHKIILNNLRAFIQRDRYKFTMYCYCLCRIACAGFAAYFVVSRQERVNNYIAHSVKG